MTSHCYSHDSSHDIISFFSQLLSTCIVLLHQQVQYILASTSPSGRSVVWDLHKNEPIITVAGTSTKVNCSYSYRPVIIVYKVSLTFVRP